MEAFWNTATLNSPREGQRRDIPRGARPEHGKLQFQSEDRWPLSSPVHHDSGMSLSPSSSPVPSALKGKIRSKSKWARSRSCQQKPQLSPPDGDRLEGNCCDAKSRRRQARGSPSATQPDRIVPLISDDDDDDDDAMLLLCLKMNNYSNFVYFPLLTTFHLSQRNCCASSEHRQDDCPFSPRRTAASSFSYGPCDLFLLFLCCSPAVIDDSARRFRRLTLPARSRCP